MQLIEVNETGVHAALIRLGAKDSSLQWLVFPMIHLGSTSYYAAVQDRMAACDLVLAEGLDSRIARAITMAYRAADGSGRLGDARAQPEEVQRGVGPEVVNADMSAADFDAAWSRMPLGVRLVVPLVAPLYGLWLRWFARPQELHHHLHLDDLPSLENEVEQIWPGLFDLLVHRRDDHLGQEIDLLHERHRHESRTVGVAWGAAHVEAVIDHLTRLGYSPLSTEWITVFGYS